MMKQFNIMIDRQIFICTFLSIYDLISVGKMNNTLKVKINNTKDNTVLIQSNYIYNIYFI